MLKVVQILMIVLGLIILFMLSKDLSKKLKNNTLEKGSPLALSFIGIIANFFDTLGIGSFAIETGFFKNFKLVDDRLIPGTLNVGATIPTIVEALIFLTAIKVEPITLFSMIFSSVLGAIFGAAIVSKLNKRAIQISMGFALIFVAIFILGGLLHLFPAGGNLKGLTGIKLIIALIGNFIIGALNTLGIGNYAPCMALVFALGMDPKVAFPIMMGSAALLMPAASFKFIKEEAHSTKASFIIGLLGPIGVLVAAFIVKSLPLGTLKWVVVGVLIYTSIAMFKSAKDTKKNIAAVDNKKIAA
ncbi:Sulfite exporter TauE/SafE [Caloramator quimbayensis]|uniref:Sulfite exporter TauE/SafE n=1 Tax=Caloramator quimbayensis TaxID=1147123 RepID=A0A1T4X5G0_9CLOT|nr:sulfite exporter TauE/SafE family protein [Caloramator quimbayensis]SKA84669.1 Sulfite exporter TauE/SafE [Caloramator quimbayensis]